MTADFFPDMEQRQHIAGRDFLTQIELEWLPHSEVWSGTPIRFEGVEPTIGRMRVMRHWVDGESVSKEEYDEAIIEAVRFAELVEEPIKPAPFIYLTMPPGEVPEI